MEKFFEIEALVGLDKNNRPVSNYSDAIFFDVTDESDGYILCWGLYQRLPEIGEARHIADFPSRDNAEVMVKFLEANIQLSE